MNIALMSHDNRKDLMVQFCTAYAATAEMLILGLARGDLDWRMIVNPASNRPIA